MMNKKSIRKNAVSLPSVREKDQSYVTQSIERVKKGCYGSNRQLKIDDAYGDHNMHLFRLKNKKKYIRDIPTALTPTIKELLT